MHEHLERATAHSRHETIWSCNHRICNHRFLRPDSKNKFSSFWFYSSLLDKQCWKWKLCAQEATEKSWRVENYRAGCMLKRKESSSFMERYAKEGCRWAFIPLIFAIPSTAAQFEDKMERWRKVRHLFLNALPYCTASASVIVFGICSWDWIWTVCFRFLIHTFGPLQRDVHWKLLVMKGCYLKELCWMSCLVPSKQAV